MNYNHVEPSHPQNVRIAAHSNFTVNIMQDKHDSGETDVRTEFFRKEQ